MSYLQQIVSASYLLPNPTGLSTPAQSAKAWNLACAASSARLVVYSDDDPSDDDLELLGDEVESGVSGCNATTGICTQPECTIKAKFKVPEDNGAPDDRRFRIIADAVAAKIIIPTDESSELDNPFPVGCSGADDELGDCCGNNKPCKHFVEQNKTTDVPVYQAAQRMVQSSHEVIVRVHAGTCTDPNLPPV